jgi:hypothetical protein
VNKQIETMLEDIDVANRGPVKRLWEDLTTHLPKAPGSKKSHQAWDYGYKGHIQDVMNLAYILYERLSEERKLEFSLPSALLVLFLHDCEKPFKHASDAELKNFPWVAGRPIKSDKNFQRLLVDHYGFKLSDEEWNGLHYVEGEGDDYIEGERIQGPLAAFCHVCDVISARIWHDYPEVI